MSALCDPDPYNDTVFRHELTALYGGGDLQVGNGDLARTKDGALRLGSIPFNAMFRLVQFWRLNAPAMRLMFDTIRELRDTASKLEKKREEILSKGPAQGRFLDSNDVESYHTVNDAIGAGELSRSAMAGSLMIVLSSLLGRFKDDLDASPADWNAGSPKYANYSIGEIVGAAANSFRHEDEWTKALFAKKITKRQRLSMEVLRSALGWPIDSDTYYPKCEAVLDLISGGDFDQLAKAILIFANGVALQAETRSVSP